MEGRSTYIRPDRPSPRRAFLLGAIAIAPPVAILLLAFPSLLDPAQPRFPCPLYPNAVTSMTSGFHEGCELPYGTRIRSVRDEKGVVFVDDTNGLGEVLERLKIGPVSIDLDPRGSAEVRTLPHDSAQSIARVTASVVLCGILIAIVLLTAVRAKVDAALPFALIYGSVGALIAGAIAGWSAPAVYPVTAAARMLLAAAILDLAMVFPRPRDILDIAPSVRSVPYAFFGVILLAELDATYRAAHTSMVLVQKVSFVLLAGSMLLLCVACYLAMRESPSLLERRQATAFLKGLVGLCAATQLLSIADPSSSAFSATVIGAALSPLPLGYAIARYHLFDLDLAVRRAAAHLVYLLAISTIVFLAVVIFREALTLPDLVSSRPVLFALVFGCIAPLDLLRSWVASSIQTVFRPNSLAWDQLLDDPSSTRIAGLSSVQEIASRASRILAAGLPKTHNAVFTLAERRMVLAHATGPPACTDSGIAELAATSFPGRLVDLNRVELDEAGETIYEAGVELSCPIGTGDEILGWLIVSPARRGMFFSAGHLSFVESIAAQAASALHSIELKEALVISERFAAKGRVHAELAHEIGKPLGTLEILAKKLEAGAVDAAARPRVVESIARLAGQLRSIVRGVLEAGSMPTEAAPVLVPDLIEQALREVAEVRGEGRVVVHAIPQVPTLPLPFQRLGRLIVNLLHNAIEASDPDDTVELSVDHLAGTLSIEVSDDGRGMSPDQLACATEPFVSFRPEGNGLGLAIAAETVRQLGGRFELSSELGTGTRARISISAEAIQGQETSQ